MVLIFANLQAWFHDLLYILYIAYDGMLVRKHQTQPRYNVDSPTQAVVPGYL